MDKQCRSIQIVISVVFLLLVPNSAFTKSFTFQREYTYQASEADSKLSCRAIALEQVKRLLLEELGTYLEAHTEVRDYQLTKDQITTLTAGIVQTEIVDEKWDGREYWLRAKVVADPDEVAQSIDALRKDRQKSKELEEIRKKADEALKEIERLKKELAANGKNVSKLKEYGAAIDGLSAIDWYERGKIYFESRNWHKAIWAFSKALEIDPKGTVPVGNGYSIDGGIYVDRGLAFSELERFTEAIHDFDKAIELNPDLAVAYLNRGGVYLDLNNYHKAIKDFDRAIEILPTYDTAYYCRGLSYYNTGKYQAALKDFTKYIELKPEETNGYVSRGLAYNEIGKYNLCISDMKTAAKMGDEEAQAFLRSKGIKW